MYPEINLESDDAFVNTFHVMNGLEEQGYERPLCVNLHGSIWYQRRGQSNMGTWLLCL